MKHGTWSIRNDGESRAQSARPFSVPNAPCSVLHAPCYAGFTLIEMIVSIAIFSFVMLATTSVLLSVIDADHKAQGLKSTINNLSLSLESMARNLRTGTGYQCGGVGGADCAFYPMSAIAFQSYNGVTTIYRQSLDGNAIEVSKDGGGSFAPITAPEITIDKLSFYVSGTGSLSARQPRVLMVVGGHVNNVPGQKFRTQSRFDIQTLVSERFPNVPGT